MVKEKYKKFVINYEPFEWEIKINPSEFREYIKDKHNFIINFIRFYKVFLYLEKLKEDNLKNPKILDVGAFPGNMVILSKKIFENISEYCAIGLDLDKKFENKMFIINCLNGLVQSIFVQ